MFPTGEAEGREQLSRPNARVPSTVTHRQDRDSDTVQHRQGGQQVDLLEDEPDAAAVGIGP